MKTKLRQAGVMLALAATWIAFAAWQYHEFTHQREREQAELLRQSDVLRQALLGGVRARRRLGRVFEDQMQPVLDEITATPGVVAVRLMVPGERVSLTAGPTELLADSLESPLWLSQGLQTTTSSEIKLMPPGQGQGGGGPAWLREDNSEQRTQQLQLTLLLDRTGMDSAIKAAAHLRVGATLAGAAVMAALGIAWLASIRTLRAKTETELLQAEKQRLEQLSQAASGLAHETRNPLGVVRGGLQRLLRNGQVDQAEDERAQLQVLIEECDRVTSRINQFLSYARPQKAELGAVDFPKLVVELESLLLPDLEEKSQHLQTQVASGCEQIIADGNLLRQLLFNLLQNAIAFSPSGEVIDIQLEKSKADQAFIRVADRGVGVAEADALQLFTPYFTTRERGTGLGLAIVKRLAQQQGWSVRYEPRPGGGSLFIVEDIRVASQTANLDR